MNTLPTLNVDNFYTIVQLSDGSLINIHIYDTLGQERFNSINESYYKKGEAVLLVYDISRKSSFDRIKNYYVKKIKESCEADIPILLLANKTDLEDKREVQTEEVAKKAEQYKVAFCETSALKGKNIEKAFDTLVEEITKIAVSQKLVEIKRESDSNTVSLNTQEETKTEKESKCC